MKKPILIAIIGFFIILFPKTIKAQLFDGNYYNELYPNVISIKGNIGGQHKTVMLIKKLLNIETFCIFA